MAGTKRARAGINVIGCPRVVGKDRYGNEKKCNAAAMTQVSLRRLAHIRVWGSATVTVTCRNHHTFDVTLEGDKITQVIEQMKKRERAQRRKYV